MEVKRECCLTDCSIWGIGAFYMSLKFNYVPQSIIIGFFLCSFSLASTTNSAAIIIPNHGLPKMSLQLCIIHISTKKQWDRWRTSYSNFISYSLFFVWASSAIFQSLLKFVALIYQGGMSLPAAFGLAILAKTQIKSQKVFKQEQGGF